MSCTLKCFICVFGLVHGEARGATKAGGPGKVRNAASQRPKRAGRYFKVHNTL